MKNKVLTFILTLIILGGSMVVKAQGNEVSGNVTDEASGSGLPDITVHVKGNTTGTITDAKGNYHINIASGNVTLLFTGIGYTPKEVPVNNQARINVKLSVSSESLNSVVVIGYGTVNKKDLTGSVSTVKGKDLDAFPASNIQLALSGRSAGVQVMQNSGAPGAAISIRIRGTNSISGDNEPLYVIDGFPTSNSRLINNSDIESIEVLKDASATAIYGSRGANGVVIITTKSGKAGTTEINYESNFAVQQLRKKLDMMNAQEYVNYENLIASSLGQAPRFTDAEVQNVGKGFDWQDFVYHKALMQNHSLNIQGGNDKTKFSVSGSFFGQDGLVRNSGYYRYSLASKIDHKISDKLEFKSNVILTYTKVENQNSSGGGRGISLIAGSYNAFPTLTPYESDGTIRDLRSVYPWNPEILNPAYFIDETSSVTKSNNVLANVSLIYRPIADLSIQISGGIQSTDNRSSTFYTSKYASGVSSASMSRPNSTSYLNENLVKYNKTFGKSSLEVTAGFTFQDFRNTNLSASGTGFLSDLLDVYNLQSAGTPGIPSSSYSYSVLLSSLGRINYNYDERFLATVNFRADGSSVYSPGDKWGYFPSGALAWRISKEKFFDVSFISDLKIRAGWGITGSQAISPYSTLKMLYAGTTGFGNGVENYFVRSSTVPGNLKWETTKQSNVGIDLSLFDYRLNVTADYYLKNTSNLLNPVPLSPSTGYANSIENIGSMRNQGAELEISGTIISKTDLKWDVSGNIAFNKNQVTKLYGGDDIPGGSYNVTLLNEMINIVREGEPLGVFYGYKQDGYNENGLLKYKDMNGDGVINSDDKVILGNPNPKITYGFNTSLFFKGFDLTAFFQGVAGRDIFNLSEVNPTLDVVWGANMLKDVYYNTWTPENTNAKYPKPSNSNVVRVSDRFIENGSYLRLRNIQLSYNLPLEKWNAKKIKQLQVYIGGQNLMTVTKYSWWDPEVNSEGGGSSIDQGIDYNTYPNYKSFNFGIRATF